MLPHNEESGGINGGILSLARPFTEANQSNVSSAYVPPPLPDFHTNLFGSGDLSSVGVELDRFGSPVFERWLAVSRPYHRTSDIVLVREGEGGGAVIP